MNRALLFTFALFLPALAWSAVEYNCSEVFLEDTPVHPAVGKWTWQLDKSSELRIAVSENSSDWSKHPHRGGATASAVGQKIIVRLPNSEKTWNNLAIGEFAEVFGYFTGERIPPEASLSISSSPYKSADFREVVMAVTEGTGHSEKNVLVIKRLHNQIRAMLRVLGETNNLQTLSVKSQMDFNSSGTKRNVQLYMFVNKETKKAITIFTTKNH